jgi:phosphoesterase RecJ-like protein
MFKKVIELIEKYDRIIIHRHSNPDGDAIGSQVGLKNILKENYPEKEIYAVGDASKRYGFIEDSATDTIPDDYYNDALVFILDTSAKFMISDERYTLAKTTIKMDHHIFCEEFADLEVIDTSFESCCGLIGMFAMQTGLKVTPLAAKALYTGMITDSGRFRYDSTSSQTFKVASFLMEQKFNTNDIFSNLYADELASVQLRAKFVLKITKTDAKKLVKKAYKVGTLDDITDSIYNKGVMFEKLIWERNGMEFRGKDSVPFYKSGDITIDGKEIQIKYLHARICYDKVLTKLKKSNFGG